MRIPTLPLSIAVLRRNKSSTLFKPSLAWSSVLVQNFKIVDLTARAMSNVVPNDTNNNKSQSHRQFGQFQISSSQIFYESPSNLTAAIVNLRPIVQGHVLVIPTRVVPKISGLNSDEYDDLWRSVRCVQKMLEDHYNAGGFNVAVQDGVVAGQSVNHVHVHILPRVSGDFERNDDIYDELNDWAPTDELCVAKVERGVQLEVQEDEDRKSRTMKEMEDEASVYRSLLSSTPKVSKI